MTHALTLLCLVAATAGELPTPAESARSVVAAAKAKRASFPKALSQSLAASDDARDVWQAVATHTLVEVEINPEMRVKVAAGPADTKLVARRWTPFIVRIENRCGATARLSVTATDLASTNGDAPEWLDVEIADLQGHSDRLSGAPVEYKLILCRISEPGRREVRLGFDAGQGTQDIGFRGVTDVLFHVQDHDSGPTGD